VIVVSDATVLIGLAKIGKLELRRKKFRISEKIVLEGLKKAGEID
jgi:predicted nucleic acid-binding protein